MLVMLLDNKTLAYFCV
ncbi:hypothetical protein F383_04624 [Gossypium arboreum]|uniref:Uncharacterized protein n=1 Tax=Gossypium arboreum TaxID=29729 RepID=A0A0B0PPW6_GOSAR|nr:hypothetical protein F383_04624 [Gossypium arboreum]